MSKHISYLLVVTSLFLTSCGQTTEANSEQAQEVASEIPQTPSKIEPSMMPAEKKKVSEVAPLSGSYITLAKFETEKSKYSESDVVLFFNANWCSTCKIARENIESSLTTIPKNLTIVVVDFDSEIELRRKYGVVIQHTFVQIDSSGKELTKWSGSVTAQAISENLV
jgi:hypothetical protein